MRFEIQIARNVAYISFLILSIILVVYATVLLFDKVAILGNAFGQLPATSTSLSSVPISVKIINPDKGQTTNVGNSLEISGESRYEPSYSCQVSVIVNDVKPYQKTKPVGVRMENDYSAWKFTINSSYTTLKEGDNRITARLLCSDDQGKDVRKWYSINVIGQTGTENSPIKRETVSIPTSTESKSGISKTTIEIDRNVFIDLINDRIRNSTGTIRDTIEDTLMYVYSGTR
jgi:hypothetical protein